LAGARVGDAAFFVNKSDSSALKKTPGLIGSLSAWAAERVKSCDKRHNSKIFFHLDIKSIEVAKDC